MTTRNDEAWLPTNARSSDRMRLLCLPHVGGGSAMFHRWALRLVDRVNVVPVKLPGREDRTKEPAFDDLRQLVRRLSSDLTNYVQEQPLALFGHSMGGLICFEWARQMQAAGIEVQHVFVSSCRPPHRFRMPDQPMHQLPDRQMIEHLNGKYGTGTATSNDELDLMLFMAPTIRADLKLLETYSLKEGSPPLSCPLSVLGGTDDKQITRVVLQEWERYTASDFKLRIFPGHHFYIRSQDEAVTKFIAQRLS